MDPCLRAQMEGLCREQLVPPCFKSGSWQLPSQDAIGKEAPQRSTETHLHQLPKQGKVSTLDMGGGEGTISEAA